MAMSSQSISLAREVGEIRGTVRLAALVLVVLFLAGCAKGAISRIELDPTQPIVCDTSVTPNICGVPNNQPVFFLIRGRGVCDPVLSACGNGLSGKPYGYAHDFGQPPSEQPLRIECSYNTGWPGPKTIRAYSNGSDCVGEASLRVNVMSVGTGHVRSDFQLGFGQPGTTACSQVPSIRLPLRKGTVVSIKTNPDPNVKVNFGCLFNGCIYDADGEPNSVAPASFPFPGLRKYSLVLRVGQQVVQGGTNMSFTTNQGGHLEVCVNDDNLADNTGAWGIGISIDESQAP